MFTNILDVKNRTTTRQFGAVKCKRKEIKYKTPPWAFKKKRKVNSKVNDQLKKSLDN